MNIYLLSITGFYLFFYLLNLFADILNISAIDTHVPEEFDGIYNDDRYRDSQAYLRESTQFSIIQTTVSLIVLFALIFTGAFNSIDLWVRSFGLSEVWTGVSYILVLLVGSQIINAPFSFYSTFKIEEKYDFNTSTKTLFFTDMIKGLVISSLIGSLVLYGILWFFEQSGTAAWLYAWGFMVLVQLILVYVAPTVIMPLFNTFIPLEEGELKQSIMDYAKRFNFALKEIYTMDGSKRSKKSNAFFTGFGKQKRIVLFDTLVERHNTKELLGILAHEMGHFKKKHIHKSLIISVLTSGLMFYLLNQFMKNQTLFDAFQMQHLSVYASLVFFGFLFKPLSELLGIVSQILSRKHEFEADAFAVETTKDKQSFIDALKQLSVDNLSNLTPHPVYVFLHYSHPPVIKRIEHIQDL